MDTLINTLAQTGATAILAFLLIQLQREQMNAHRQQIAELIAAQQRWQEEFETKIADLTSVINALDAQIARLEIRLQALAERQTHTRTRKENDDGKSK